MYVKSCCQSVGYDVPIHLIPSQCVSAMKNEEYISINKIAELKGLNSNRSLRLAIQKGKYIARVVKVFGGKSYEILYSSLELEIQRILRGVAERVSQSEQMTNDEFGICATVDRRRKSFAKQNSTGAKVNQSTITIQTFGKINTRFWKF